MAGSALIGRVIMGLPPVVVDPTRRWGVAGRPREIADTELPRTWQVGGGEIRVFGVVVPLLGTVHPVPGLHLPGVSRIMRDMLSIRLMTEAEIGEMRRRVEMLREHGRDAYAVAGMLAHRGHRAIVEPFWFPALMTNGELAQHLSLSADVVDAANVITGTTTVGGLGAGPAAARNAAVGAAAWTAGWAAVNASFASTHYGTRAEAYRTELTRRGITPP